MIARMRKDFLYHPFCHAHSDQVDIPPLLVSLVTRAAPTSAFAANFESMTTDRKTAGVPVRYNGEGGKRRDTGPWQQRFKPE